MAFVGSLMGLLTRSCTFYPHSKFTCAFYLVGRRPHAYGPLLSYDGEILRCQSNMCPSHGSMNTSIIEVQSQSIVIYSFGPLEPQLFFHGC